MFKIDILGETIFKTTDGNMVLTTESNSSISNIDILSENNINLTSNQGNILFKLNNNNNIEFKNNNETFLNISPDKGIRGLKYSYNNLDDNSINLSSYDSNSIITLRSNSIPSLVIFWPPRTKYLPPNFLTAIEARGAYSFCLAASIVFAFTIQYPFIFKS